MPGRDDILAKVDSIYEARVADDIDGLAGHLAAGATFLINAHPQAAGAMPLGPVDAREAIGGLIHSYRFHSAERVDAIVEGTRAAVRMRVQVSARGGGEAVTSEFVDLWEFDADGQVRSLAQFIDTALAARIVGAG